MQITKPTLLVDKAICQANISRMAKKCATSGASMRPHFKTHHSAEVGDWFRDFGVTTCTASSVTMAEYFVDHGWDDVTIAFPYNPLESEDISKIAANAAINILIESEESWQLAAERITNPVGYFVKVDVGTHRTGLNPANISLIEKLVTSKSSNLQFKGFLGHAGHTYGSRDESHVHEIFSHSAGILKKLKAEYGGIISYGDTPSCSMLDDFSGIDEIRAGNFVFYDWMQKKIGSCSLADISVCLANPVVAVHKDRNEVVLFGGGVHLSKESILENGEKCFGKAVHLTKDGWSTQIIGNVKKLSQEHGIVQMASQDIANIKVGDLIGVIPVHSCLAADLQGHYYSTDGHKIEKILKQ